ncbi:hypothetical protein [Neoroseomonas lacus]|uniref:hypothetical protein n=1 Tax=Neoroseomonas lacus TaxID=287609 RepID=UPI00166A5C92|nr:hypothetical protein [Neoroseomonas lacus]
MRPRRDGARFHLDCEIGAQRRVQDSRPTLPEDEFTDAQARTWLASWVRQGQD